MHSSRGWGNRLPVVAVLSVACLVVFGCKANNQTPQREGPFEVWRLYGEVEDVDTRTAVVRCTITAYHKYWYKDSSKPSGEDVHKLAKDIPTGGDRFTVTFTSIGGSSVQSHSIEIVGAAEVTDIVVPPEVRDWGSRNEGCALAIVSADGNDRAVDFERDPPVVSADQLSDMYFNLGGTRE